MPKFLITHPEFTFLLKENKQQLSKIFAYNLPYTGGVNGYSRCVQFIFPIFNIWIVISLALGLLIAFIKDRFVFLLFPLIFIIVFFFNVLLSYNADVFEVERHLFITNIVIQFLGILSFAVLIDNINFELIIKNLKSRFC